MMKIKVRKQDRKRGVVGSMKIDITKLKMPNITAEEICGVQPLPAIVGEIFELRYQTWLQRMWYRISTVFSRV